MNKKLLALLCAGLLVGCGPDSSSNDGDDGDQGEDITSPLTSLGADGWAISSMEVTGGHDSSLKYLVTTREELIEALYGDRNTSLNTQPSNVPKIIYIQGTIDLALDTDNQTMDGSDFIQKANAENNCDQYGYTDIDTFYADYNEAYDPHTWGDSEVTGELENARQCYQRYQAKHVVFRVGSNTSILGLGNDAEIKHGTLRLGSNSDPEPVENIVIRNITFSDAFDYFPQWDPSDATTGRWNSEYDLISVDYAKGVWIDHNTFSDGDRPDEMFPSVFAAPYNKKEHKVQHHDGLVDITNGATQVTLSYNHFKNHDKTSLLGGSDTPNPSKNYGPGAIDVTFHHNYWQNTGQRLPRVRFGRVHVYNNYYKLDATGDTAPSYTMGDTLILGTAAKIYAESNVFDIANSSNLVETKLIRLNSTMNNKIKCVNEGYSDDECGTYFFGTENKVNNSFRNFNNIASNQDSSGVLTILDPNDVDAFWLPSFSYEYQADITDDVKDLVMRSAGAGKLIEEE